MRTRALAPPDSAARAGLHELNLHKTRDTLVYIPVSAAKHPKVPVVLALHGATQNAERGIALLQKQADDRGFMLVAPCSAATTWEIEGAWGADFDNVDRSLALSFNLRQVDPARIAIAGFSDGASYSLSLGLSNGDLFHAVMGFSTGYLAQQTRVGMPSVFLSQGTRDPIFNIDSTGRPIARNLKRDGYDVTLLEFDGGHAFPPDIANAAAAWLAAVRGLA